MWEGVFCWEGSRHTSVSLNLCCCCCCFLFHFYVLFCTLEVPPDSGLAWTRKKRGKYSKELASESPVVLVLAGCSFFSGALGVAGCLGCCWGCLGAKSLVHPKQLPQLFEVSALGGSKREREFNTSGLGSWTVFWHSFVWQKRFLKRKFPLTSSARSSVPGEGGGSSCHKAAQLGCSPLSDTFCWCWGPRVWATWAVPRENFFYS